MPFFLIPPKFLGRSQSILHNFFVPPILWEPFSRPTPSIPDIIVVTLLGAWEMPGSKTFFIWLLKVTHT